VPSINELFRLDGRIAIVTGGSRGIGREMAEGLAEAGASLMLCARREEWLTPTVTAMRVQGFTVEGALCDVAKAADVQSVVDQAIATYGRVDILVNNAGVTWAAEPEDMTLAQWQKVVDINLTGAFLFAQAAGRDMLKRQWGRIINIASIAGMRSMPMHAYAPAKAAVIAITECLAAEWGRSGVRVNAVSPGYTLTRALQAAIDKGQRDGSLLNENSALGRMVSTEEVARAVCFLASEDASAITGANLPVDCGWLVTPSWHTYGGLRPARR